MKKIGIITHNYPRTSLERRDAGVFLYDFAQRLSDSCKVKVFCNDYGGKKEVDSKISVTWYRWSKDTKKFGNWKIFSPFSFFNFVKLLTVGKKKTLEFCMSNKIDFNLAAWVLPSGFFAAYVKKMINIPYAVWCLGSDLNKYSKIPILRFLIKNTLKNADMVFANSRSLVMKAEKISGRQATFLPAVTDIDLKDLNFSIINKKYFNFLFVGRLEKVKGPDKLIRSIDLLKNINANFRLNIIGDGTLMKRLVKMVKKFKLNKHVKFIGWAKKETVLSYMKNSDCLVIPSRSESFPLIILEAAKMGLPVVSTNVGDCGLIVSKYKIGYLVEKNNSEQIANKMYQIMKKGDNVRAIFKPALKKIVDDFSIDKTVREFIKNINL